MLQRNALSKILVVLFRVPTLHSLWVIAGPAIVLLGLSQGSGELWLLPKLHAKFGTQYSWIIFYGSLLQIPILFEAMRTVILTGENPLALLARISRPWAFFFLTIAIVTLGGAGGFILTVGDSLWRLFGWPNNQMLDPMMSKKLWSLACACAFALPIWLKLKHIERYLEIVVGTCAALSILLFLTVICVRLEFLIALPKFMLSSLVPHGLSQLSDLSKGDLTTIVVGFTLMGLGGWYCLFFPVWGKNRGVGMSGVSKEPPFEGLALAEDSQENESRLKAWIKSSWLGSMAGLAGNAFTVMLTSFLAYKILFSSGREIGSEWDLVTQQASFFEPVLGTFAPIAFMLAVGAFFADTWLAVYASLSQLISETLRVSFRGLRNISEMRLFHRVFMVVSVASLFPMITPISPGSLLLKWVGLSMFLSMPVLCGLLYYLNYCIIPTIGPSFYRPTRFQKSVFLLSWIVYLLMSAGYIWLVI